MSKQTAQAKHELSTAVEDAKRVIANATAEALKVSSTAVSNDHDLLIRIETQLQRVISDVNEIKSNTVGRIDQLEINSINKSDHDKVVTDIVMLKNWKNWLLGSNAVIVAIGTFLAIKLFEHLIK